jgi:Ca-activated chloride channel family protein
VREKNIARKLYGLVLMVAAAIGASAQPQKPEPAGGGDYRISLEVDLVLLDVTVLDRKGHFVTDLDRDSFRVYEDGRPQKIEVFQGRDVPAAVGLVVDNSGSMRGKREQVIAASVAFAQSSNPADEMFVVNFNEEVSMGLPAGTEFTGDPEQLRAALARSAPAGQTALYDAVTRALDHLQKARLGRKALIVVSDGGDNSSLLDFRQMLQKAQQSNATIYTIALINSEDRDQNPSVLKRLAKETGGDFSRPSQAAEVLEICRRIAADLRNQYVVGYVPSNTNRDGSYRSIKVTASAPGKGQLKVRTRTGYFATAGQPAGAEESAGVLR